MSTKEIVDTMERDSTQERPRRRFYSAELKAQVLEQCRQAGASVAGVALSHNINPNMVHRWIREVHQRTVVAQAELATGAFIPLQLQAAPVANDVAQPGLTQVRADTDPADIRIEEVRRGTGTVTVNWPLEGAQDAIANANSRRANGRRGKTISQERHSPQRLLKT